MSEKKTVRFPVGDNPSSDAIPVFMLDSNKINNVAVTPAGVQHECDATTDIVVIYVPVGAVVLVGTGGETDPSHMWDLVPGYHPLGLSEDGRTLSLKAASDVSVKILEIG